MTLCEIRAVTRHSGERLKLGYGFTEETMRLPVIGVLLPVLLGARAAVSRQPALWHNDSTSLASMWPRLDDVPGGTFNATSRRRLQEAGGGGGGGGEALYSYRQEGRCTAQKPRADSFASADDDWDSD